MAKNNIWETETEFIRNIKKTDNGSELVERVYAHFATVVKELNGTVYTAFFAPRVLVASHVMLLSILL